MINPVYLKGDATRPQGDGVKIIAHVCNDIGAWGAGFVLAISKRWSAPKNRYIKEHGILGLTLGDIQFVEVGKDLYVSNMIAQKGIHKKLGPPIRYDALERCLGETASKAKLINATVHMPRIGCGLAGGKWTRVETLIQKTMIEQGVSVFVYDLK